MYRQDKDLREKLETMESVPTAFQFDAAATWLKIEEQLQPDQSKKKRVVWLYWAAAMFVSIIGCYLFFSENSHKPINKADTATVNNANSTKKISKEITSVTAIGNETVINQTNSKNQIKQLKSKEEVTDSIIQKNQPSSIVPNVNTANNISPADTSMQVAAQAKPVKKKLKIIYLNQLEEQEPISVAQAKQNKKKAAINAEEDAPTSSGTKTWWFFKSRANNN